METMREEQWAASIKELLLTKLGKSIKVETQKRLPYLNEIAEYDLNFNPKSEVKYYATDLLIYEQTDSVIKPRVIIEAKMQDVTTHDAITYSEKAQCHKNVTPYLRYGIMLCGSKGSLPWRLFKHGANFDFMISFQEKMLNEAELKSFLRLLKEEIEYSRQIEKMLLNSQKAGKERYFILQNKLHLE